VDPAIQKEMTMTDSVTIRPQAAVQQPQAQRLFALAQDLEASFLSEMLGHTGLGTTPEAFGGGHGEDQFASFLRQEQARIMVDSGGVGLAEHLFKAMSKGAADV
jgi:peptidoglycan hydrolase FlgJ